MRGPSDLNSPSALIADIESEIEGLEERATHCRKSMLASKVAIVAGALLIIALFLGVIDYHTTLFTLAVAAFLGGVVWYGANRSTLIVIEARIKALSSRRIELIDQLEMRTIE